MSSHLWPCVLLVACVLLGAIPASAVRAVNSPVMMGDLLDLCGQDSVLKPGVQNCATSQSIPMNSIQQYTVTIGPGSTFVMVVQLRSTFGDADLQVVGPTNVTWTSAERIGEDVVNVSRLVLQDHPGTYLINIIGYEQITFYQVSIQTSSMVALPNLVSTEQFQLWKIYKACCVQDDYFNSSTCNRLAQATAPGHLPEQDMCNLIPNVCDSDGHLVKLVLSGDSTGNFVCNGSFPWAFANFSRLQTLDLSHNSIISPVSAMVDTVTQLTNLQRLFLSNNLLNGTFDCRLAQMPSLQTLWLSRNLLHGNLPSCIVNSKTLQQIDLSQNLLTGALTDFPAESAFEYIDLSDNGMPDGPGNGPGISGTIPASITNVKALQHLALQGNSLTGTIPLLPDTLDTLILASNKLTGQIPAGIGAAGTDFRPSNLHIFNISQNLLTGSLPVSLPSVVSLQTLDASSNQLTSGLDALWNTNYLAEFNVSRNLFAQNLPSTLASLAGLRVLDVSHNQLKGGLQGFAAHLPAAAVGSGLLTFDVSDNSLTGTLPPALAVMQMLNEPSQSTVAEGAASYAYPSIFRVDGNRFSQQLPQWLMAALASTYDVTNSADVLLTVKLNGGQNTFTCPPPITSADQLLPGLTYLQGLYNLTCVSPDGSVPLTSALNYAAFAFPPSPAAFVPPDLTAPVPGTPDDNSSSGSSMGAIIGGVVGGMVVIGLVAGGVWYWQSRGRRLSSGGSSSSRREHEDLPMTWNTIYEYNNGRMGLTTSSKRDHI